MNDKTIASALLVGVILASVGDGLQAQNPVPAVPVEPIAAVLDAIRSHRAVGLGTGDLPGDFRTT
jgi:hypothetical protein